MKTGRKSTAELSTPHVYLPRPDRLAPPPDLTPEGRTLFLDIVLANEATHFRPSDTVLLSAYVRACLLEQEASATLAANGHVTGDGKVSPWLSVLAQALKTMSTLAHRLRLSPQGRSPSIPKRVPPTSYYDRMRLEHGDDEPPPTPRPWDDWSNK